MMSDTTQFQTVSSSPLTSDAQRLLEREGTTGALGVPVDRHLGPIRRWAMMGFALAGTMLGGGSLAGAQQEAGGSSNQAGGFDRPLGEPERPRQGREGRQTSSRSTITIIDNGTRYQVETMDGETTVEVDGKPLPADRWRSRDGRIEILDADGNVQKAIPIGVGGMPLGRDAGQRERGQADGRVRELVQEMQRNANVPPVMLGITMRMEVQDDQPGRVIIEAVREGLPADKAGLREGDVLLEVGGTPVTDQSQVRDALRDRKAGEQMDILVERDGRRRTFTVTLEAWSQERMGGQQPGLGWNAVPLDGDMMLRFGEGGVDGQGWNGRDMSQMLRMFGMEDNSARVERLRDQRRVLEDLARELRADKGDQTAFREQAAERLLDAVSELRKLERELGEGGRSRMLLGPGGREPMVFVNPPDVPVPPVPPTPRARNGDAGDQRSLAEQLERLQKRLDEMERRMEERPR